MDYCAIDFGTSNSAVARVAPAGDRHACAASDTDDDGLGHPAGPGRLPAKTRLVPLEGAELTLPSAVFFNADENTHCFGRAAIAEYIDGYDGRLMRSLKSILGSPLAEQSTDVGGGRALPFLDIIALFLRHLVTQATQVDGEAPRRAVLGRPVFFVDDDPEADRAAEAQLAQAARNAGLEEVHFQYEPIAAAFDYESRLSAEELVLVADIGGGTSDFSLVRVGPERRHALERQQDVLGHHGVHVAGTDFDRRVELDAILPAFGYRSLDPQGRELPNRIYYDLATWHRINAVYTPRRVTELRLARHLFRDPRHFLRLMTLVERRLGHKLAAQAEQSKIALAGGGATRIALEWVEEGLELAYDGARMVGACADETERIVAAARETTRAAGVPPERVAALYFTGGSTGLNFLSTAIHAAFPAAHAVHGDRLASVAIGLGIHAARLFA